MFYIKEECQSEEVNVILFKSIQDNGRIDK